MYKSCIVRARKRTTESNRGESNRCTLFLVCIRKNNHLSCRDERHYRQVLMCNFGLFRQPPGERRSHQRWIRESIHHCVRATHASQPFPCISGRLRGLATRPKHGAAGLFMSLCPIINHFLAQNLETFARFLFLPFSRDYVLALRRILSSGFVWRASWIFSRKVGREMGTSPHIPLVE
jgi:hypothetical protein